MSKDTTLSGFSALFDSIGGQIDPAQLGDVDIAAPDGDDETEFDSVKNDSKPDEADAGEPDGDEPDDDISDDDVGGDDEPAPKAKKDAGDDEPDAGRDDTVVAFFDALAETAGWDGIEDDDKPKTAEELLEYMRSVVEENSKPAYSNDDVAALDEYVRNGGSMLDFISGTSGDVDYDKLDTDNEDVQRKIVGELLSRKGYTDEQIKRKISKYQDADILEDEAVDSIELLKEMDKESKKALLEEQKISHSRVIEEQQNFYNNVIGEIEALTDIRGIKIPKQDQKALAEYIFKAESDGMTRYQKDYAKSPKNLIESAYFTMKGDSLLSSAKKSGETSAVEKLKHTLNSTKVSGSKQKIDNRSAQPLWSVASSQLLRRPK